MSRRLKKGERRLLAWIEERGSVTIAHLVERDGSTIREALARLRDLAAAGLLVRTGGGPGQALTWHASRSRLSIEGSAP